MTHYVDPGVRRAVVTAYDSLLEGDADPLVELFAPAVEWTDSIGRRRVRRIRGRAEVADHLRSRLCDRQVDLCGIAIHAGSIAVEFRQPWWIDRSLLRRLVSSAFGVTFTQTLALGDVIERIDNAEVFTSLAPEMQQERDMFALLLGR